MTLSVPNNGVTLNQTLSTTTTMTALDERTAFAKLEALKDIRNKTISLEKTRVSLLCDVTAMEEEDRCLSEYRREMELLQQEKMAHVEELRQIHADINAMETILKQADESRRMAQDSARKLLSEYIPLKQDVNRMRTDLLDLEKLPDLPDDDKDRLISSGILDKSKSLNDPWPMPPNRDHEKINSSSASIVIPPPQPNPFFTAALNGHHSLGPLSHLGLSKPGFQHHSGSITPLPNPPPFRYQQQPPPMKSCLSCHQQIHRNAPICPLCKAKSRSRNPKKPKNSKSNSKD